MTNAWKARASKGGWHMRRYLRCLRSFEAELLIPGFRRKAGLSSGILVDLDQCRFGALIALVLELEEGLSK